MTENVANEIHQVLHKFPRKTKTLSKFSRSFPPIIRIPLRKRIGINCAAQLKIEYNARKMIELQEQKQGVEKQIAFFTADLSMLSSTRERDWEN